MVLDWVIVDLGGGYVFFVVFLKVVVINVDGIIEVCEWCVVVIFDGVC